MAKIEALGLVLFLFLLSACHFSTKEKLDWASKRNSERTASEQETITQAAYSQHGFYIPSTINECMLELDKSLTAHSKLLISSLKWSDLKRISEPMVFSEWGLDDSSRVCTMFRDLGLFETRLYRGVILTCYYRYVRQKPLGFEKEVLRLAKKIEKKNAAKKKERERILAIDKIDGVYIPKDLNDCFVRLSVGLNHESINKIKNTPDSAIGDLHFSLGLWIRNNWKLWGRSRLQLYFMDRGVNHPDDMSSLILCSYHRYLNGSAIDLEGQIKKQQLWYQSLSRYHPRTSSDSMVRQLDDDGYTKFFKERKQEIVLEQIEGLSGYFDD